MCAEHSIKKSVLPASETLRLAMPERDKDQKKMYTHYQCRLCGLLLLYPSPTRSENGLVWTRAKPQFSGALGTHVKHCEGRNARAIKQESTSRSANAMMGWMSSKMAEPAPPSPPAGPIAVLDVSDDEGANTAILQ